MKDFNEVNFLKWNLENNDTLLECSQNAVVRKDYLEKVNALKSKFNLDQNQQKQRAVIEFAKYGEYYNNSTGDEICSNEDAMQEALFFLTKSNWDGNLAWKLRCELLHITLSEKPIERHKFDELKPYS